MKYRAPPSGITLTTQDAAIVKAMLLRGDRQHDIAAWFGVNGGRIAEIATGKTFATTPVAVDDVPPPGPYPAGREAVAAIKALGQARRVIAETEMLIQKSLHK